MHLAHGSPRFSEDLDFLVSASLKLDFLSAAMQARLDGTSWLPSDTKLTVSKAKDGRNPHAFIVTIGELEVIGAVRVKVELWQADRTALAALNVVVAPVRLARGAAAGMQTFVPTAELLEIYVDKVFALAARPYLKPRDVFDLHWLNTQGGLHTCSVAGLRIRLQTYPNETPTSWLGKAVARRQALVQAKIAIGKDLKRWLPSSWPLTSANLEKMTASAVQALDQGIEMMRQIEAHADAQSRPL